ncbi:hypothetical protein FSP39_025236 [Pinctada imbricata]|uniref:F-box domain-containing protein n=1 Tax=Pinctada imbricata TaxID=66713 RepID=A0AA89BJW5_PINIB|nr:hypothetical protein FSP39_025236 [Pinctada imbricata]
MDLDSHLLNLPNEITEKILQSLSLGVQDIVHVAHTCKHLNSVCQSNSLWKTKLQQRWSKLSIKHCGTNPDWRDVYKEYCTLAGKVHTFIRGMSAKFYKLEEISDSHFRELLSLMTSSAATSVVQHELMSTINNNNRWKNLTNKYYTRKAIQFVKHQLLKGEWKHHLSQPDTDQKLEDGAILLSQWCRPTEDICRADVCQKLDDLAGQVIQQLPSELADRCRQGLPLPYGTWSSDQERTVLETLNHVMFVVNGYHGNEQDYYNKDNSYLDKVIERKLGIPISLSLLYVSLARRLGIECLCVNYPSHFLIKWKEHPLATTDRQFTFIDVFHKGKFLSPNEIDTRLEVVKGIRPKQVYARMCRNLMNIFQQEARHGNISSLKSILDLYLQICPEDLEEKILCLRINIHLNVNLEELVSENLSSKIQDGHFIFIVLTMFFVPKKDKQPFYNVFTVFLCFYRYNYMCVLYGWDPVCTASEEWIIQMGVHNLPKKDKQPFYNVLVEDGSNRYAAQENLYHPSADQYCEIDHPDVGKYFMEFTGRYYIMNDEKALQYPDDAAVTRAVHESKDNDAQ